MPQFLNIADPHYRATLSPYVFQASQRYSYNLRTCALSQRNSTGGEVVSQLKLSLWRASHHRRVSQLWYCHSRCRESLSSTFARHQTKNKRLRNRDVHNVLLHRNEKNKSCDKCGTVEEAVLYLESVERHLSRCHLSVFELFVSFS